MLAQLEMKRMQSQYPQQPEIEQNDDGERSSSSDEDEQKPINLQIEFMRLCIIDAHHQDSKVKSICIHQRRELIYSLGEDKRIIISSLTQGKRIEQIKCSNMKPKTMVMHQDLDRLYVSMKQGMIFIFDIAEVTPIVMHTIQFPYPAKRMHLDCTVNTL